MMSRNHRNCPKCNAEVACGIGNDTTNGTGGNGENAMSCKDALHKLQKIDFCLVETILYLNAYPNSRQALKHYHTLLEEQKRLKERMRAAGCPPICATDNVSHDEWNWTNGPWPWETDAN